MNQKPSGRVRIARIGYAPRSSIRWSRNNLISETEGLTHTAVYDPAAGLRATASRENSVLQLPCK